MTRKRVAWSVALGLVALLLVARTVYVQRMHFFNSITFRNNDVLYLPWQWYKAPLNAQMYTVFSTNVKQVTVANQNQVRFIFSELEKGSRQRATPFNQMDSLPKDQRYNILIRTKAGIVLQMAYLYPKEKLAEIWTQHGNIAENEFISLTPSLLSYVTKKLGK